MPKNELTLVDNAIEEQQAARDAAVADSVAFELFVAEQALKPYELSAEEIEAGRVGAGDDGGIDALYTLLGDSVIDEDDNVVSEQVASASFDRNLSLTLALVQAKRAQSFEEDAIDRLSSSLHRLLDLQQTDAQLLQLYSPALVSKIRLFTRAYQKLAARHPRIRVAIIYGSRGSSNNIHAKVRSKATDLETAVRKLVPGADVEVLLLGVEELWQMVMKAPTYNLQLAFQENATSGNSHAALVRLSDYFHFIADENRSLRKHIFDWNVRDYQGGVEVNEEMRRSLADPDAPDFWWMNNGVTIISSRIGIVGKTFALDDVQIVNGLQTSHVIYEAMKANPDSHLASNRTLLCRILSTGDPEARDKVIRATNRQTAVPVSSLRATDDIQRKIETYFESLGWFYDRRKNYHRNNGRPADRIVSIPLLAQAIMSTGYSEPHNSRARPSSLLKDDHDYARIFPPDLPLETYLWVAQLQRRVDNVLASERVHASGTERTNLRFLVSMLVAARRFGGKVFNPAQLAVVASAVIPSDADIESAFHDVQVWASEHRAGDPAWPLDRKAKSAELTGAVMAKAWP